MSTHKKSRLKKLISSCLMISYLIPLPLQAMDIPQDLNLLPSETQIALITSKDNETEQRILDYKDILKMQQVCKSWLQITSQGNLWVKLAQLDGFETHPDMAHQAHYNYLKGKALMGLHILADSQVELEHPIAQEMINCLNRSAPYMHFGAISLVMDLMNSPQIPLELPCIQVPENMNLMIYPLMSKDEILQKSDEEFLQICSRYEGDIIQEDPALRERLLQIIKRKNLPYLADLINKTRDYRQKMRAPNCSSEQKEAIDFEYKCLILETFAKNKNSIIERINKAKQENDITSLDLLTKYLLILSDFTDSPSFSSSSSSSYSSSSDSSETEETPEETPEESTDDPYLPVLEEAQNLLESLKDYIHSRIPLNQAAKMGNYIDCLGTSLENEFDKNGFGPIEDPSVRGVNKHNISDITPPHVLLKDEKSLLSLLRAGLVSPIILEALNIGLHEWNIDCCWPDNKSEETSPPDQFFIEKYEAYVQLLFKHLVLKYPKLCFSDSDDFFGINPIHNTISSSVNFSRLQSRNFLTNVQLSYISHGNRFNLWIINFLLGDIENMHSSIPFLPSDKSLHPETYQKFLGFKSFAAFQADLSRTYLPKLLEQSKNQENLDLSSGEKKSIQEVLGLMYLHLGNWEEGKKYFLQVAHASSYHYYLNSLPPEKALEILNILDPNRDRGDKWTETRNQIEMKRDWQEQQRRNQQG